MHQGIILLHRCQRPNIEVEKGDIEYGVKRIVVDNWAHVVLIFILRVVSM